MSKFLKLEGRSRNWSDSQADLDVFYVLVDAVVEIVPLTGSRRIAVRITKDEYDADNADHKQKSTNVYICYKQSSEITTQDPHNYPSSHHALECLGTPDELIKQIEECRAKTVAEDAINAERALQEERGNLRVNNRGVWQVDELYQTFDVVTDPSDSSVQYIAVARSTSDTATVLEDTDFWCKLI